MEDKVNISKFKQAALDYCEFIETLSISDAQNFLFLAQKNLIVLYSLVIQLPNVAPSDAEAGDHKVANAEVQAITSKISEILGDKNLYDMVFDPFHAEPTDPVKGALSDDLSDIYLDLKSGLNSWESDNFNNAVWEWVFDFRNHWGKHAINALRAIHELLYEHMGLAEDS